MDELKVGQKRISKNKFPEVGNYIVEILSVGPESSAIRFQAMAWKDKHWVNSLSRNSILLNDYVVLDE